MSHLVQCSFDMDGSIYEDSIMDVLSFSLCITVYSWGRLAVIVKLVFTTHMSAAHPGYNCSKRITTDLNIVEFLIVGGHLFRID